MLFLCLLSLGIMFGTENIQEVTIALLGFSKKYAVHLQVPLWIVVMGSFLAGSILSIFVCFSEMMKMQWEIRKLKKQCKKRGSFSASQEIEEEEEEYTEEEVEAPQNEDASYEEAQYEEVEDFDTPQESEEIL